MSQQQQQFEGSDVHALLDEIRSTYGYDPTITRAETFRAGGMLGFFQREQYRLIVEDDPITQDATPSSRPVSYQRTVDSYPSAMPADPFAALADTTVDNNLVAVGAHIANGSSQTLAPNKPAAPRWTAAPVETQASPPSPDEYQTFDSVLQRVARVIDAPTPQSAPAAIDIEVDEPEAVGAEFLASSPAADMYPAVPGATEIAAPEIETPNDETTKFEVAKVETDCDSELIRNLTRTGLDAEWVEQIAFDLDRGHDLARALFDVFCEMPAAPTLPRRRGSLVVVAGPANRARTEARAIAGELGVDPSEIYFAAPGSARGNADDRRIRNAEDVYETVPSLRRREFEVVALDITVGSPECAWAHHVIKALRPTLVLGIVEATQKCDDVSTWVESIGDLDALIIDNPGSTVSPADLLRLEIPVFQLGSDPANPARWAATILDRVSTCA